jgi:hypothetical protein
MTPQEIADLVVTAFEGGSNYWVDYIEPGPLHHTDPKAYEGEFQQAFTVFAEDDEAPYTFNAAAVREGLKIMQERYLRHYEDILADNSDADTADVFLQCALFGEVVYG